MNTLWHLMRRNLWRHPLRAGLTVLGMVVALSAFVLLRTMLDGWFSGVEGAAKNRLVVRNKVSLVFYLPLAYERSIEQVPGVAKVARCNWFGAQLKDSQARFAQFAINENYLDMYPELGLDPEDRKAFLADRSGAIISEDLAARFGWKVGQVIQLEGTIFPGLWQFTIRGVYHGGKNNNVNATLFFNWDYLNERNRLEFNRAPDHVGIFVLELKPGAQAAVVAQSIDAQFANSFAETLTESETAFIQGFISMASAIIYALQGISVVVLVVMLLVVLNTMLMSARERYREYAILKALGFGWKEIVFLILGEATLLSATGFLALCLVLVPVFIWFPAAIRGSELAQFFPVFRLSGLTLAAAAFSALLVAFISGLVPAYSIMRVKVTEGLRRLG